MASETPTLDRLAADLVATLTAAVPDDWRIVDADAKPSAYLVPVIYYEQGDIVTTLGGALPAGWVGVEYTLTLAAPEQDPITGTRTATGALLHLLPALDGLPYLVWDKAEKLRLTSGETCYRIEVTNLTRLTDPTPDAVGATTTEPDPVPALMPEEA